jgi:hypothetical protein
MYRFFAPGARHRCGNGQGQPESSSRVMAAFAMTNDKFSMTNFQSLRKPGPAGAKKNERLRLKLCR